MDPLQGMHTDPNREQLVNGELRRLPTRRIRGGWQRVLGRPSNAAAVRLMGAQGSTTATRRARRLRLRGAATAALVLIGWGLAGCGDPDDGGGGGGGYVAEQMTGQTRSSATTP